LRFHVSPCLSAPGETLIRTFWFAQVFEVLGDLRYLRDRNAGINGLIDLDGDTPIWHFLDEQPLN